MKSLHDARGELRAARKRWRQFRATSTQVADKRYQLTMLEMDALRKKSFACFSTSHWAQDKDGNVYFPNLAGDRTIAALVPGPGSRSVAMNGAEIVHLDGGPDEQRDRQS